MDDTALHSALREKSNDYKRFLVSLALSCLGVLLLTILISVIPIIEDTFSNIEQQPLDYENFFYKWSYSQWMDSYTFELFRPSVGYYLFSPLILVLLLLSNSCVLVQDQRRIRKLVFIQWGLNAIPLVAFVVVISVLGVNNEIAMPFYVLPLLITLGFYPLIFLPIQIMLLVEKKSLMQFFAIGKKEQKPIIDNFSLRRINGIITLLIYLYAIGLLYHSAYSEIEIFAMRNKYAVTILLMFWFFTNIAIFRYKHFKRVRKNLYALAMGFTSILIIYFLIYLGNALITIEMMSFMVYNLTLPDTLVTALFYTAVIFFWSMPIGIFSVNKRVAALIATVFCAFILIIGVFIIREAFDTHYLTHGTKLFYVFVRVYYILLFYAGALWWKFLGTKLYKENSILIT